MCNAVPQLCVACSLRSVYGHPHPLPQLPRATHGDAPPLHALWYGSSPWRFVCAGRGAWRYASTVARPYCRCDTAAHGSDVLLVRSLYRRGTPHFSSTSQCTTPLAGCDFIPHLRPRSALQRTDREGCGAPHLWHNRRGSLAVPFGENACAHPLVVCHK